MSTITSRLPCVVLLVLVISVLCVNATADSEMSNVNSVPSNRVIGFNRDGRRRLRSSLSTADDGVGDRALDGWKKLSSLLKVGKRTTADKLFSKFGVGKAPENMLDSNQFVAWLLAVQMAYRQNPAMAKVDMVSSLTSRYGDRAVARMLATTEDATFVREMKTIQLNNWQRDRKTVEDVYKLLKLDKKETKLLESPLVTTWITYATKLDEANPYGAVFTTLYAHYDAKAFANMLVISKDSDDTVRVADELEMLLLKSWQREEKSVVDVFKLLQLDQEADYFFKSPLVDTLTRYATVVDKQNSFDGVFVMLQTRYNDNALTDMLIAMRNFGPRNILTNQLEELLLKTWQSGGKSTGDVFKLLKLDREGSALFNSRLLETWVSYVAKVDKENPYGKVFATLKNDFGDTTLTKMITTARDMPSTMKLAEELEKIQLNNWMKAKYSVADAFHLLRLNLRGGEVFESVGFTTWLSYANKIDRTNSDEAVLAVLRKKFGDTDLTTIIAKAKSQVALDSEDDMNVVLDRLLKLLRSKQ